MRQGRALAGADAEPVGRLARGDQPGSAGAANGDVDTRRAGATETIAARFAEEADSKSSLAAGEPDHARVHATSPEIACGSRSIGRWLRRAFATA